MSTGPGSGAVDVTRLELTGALGAVGGRRQGRAGSPRSSPGQRCLVAAAVLAAYLTIAVVAYTHAWAHPASVGIGGGAGDQAQTMWFLRWASWALVHGHDPLFTVRANYPAGVNLLAQTSVLALGVAMTPVTLLWGPVVAWNACLTLAFALTGGAGYLLCRRFVAWRPAAFVGGLLAGFSPYMVGQGFGHLQLVFAPLPPLIFLALYELVIDQQGSPWRWGGFLGALVVVQFFVSTEVLATTAMFAALALAVIALAAARWWHEAFAVHVRHAATGLGLAAAISVVLLAVPLDRLIAGPQHVLGARGGFRSYSSALLAPLLPTSLMHFGTAHLKTLGSRIGGNGSENGTYLGAPLVVFTVLAAVLVRRRVLRVAAVMALVAYILSLGASFQLGLPRYRGVLHQLPLPAVVISKIPPLDEAFPVRYSMYVVLFVAIALVVALDVLHQNLAQWAGSRDRAAPTWNHQSRGPQRPRGAAATLSVVVPAALAATVLVPLVPAWPYAGQVPVEVPSYFTTSAVRAIPSGSVALVYPYPNNKESEPQLWQAEANLRFLMPGGNFFVPGPDGGPVSFAPTFTGSVLTEVLTGAAPARTAALRTRLRAQLGSWHVRSVVAQPVGHDPVGFFTWLTGQPPSYTGGGVVAWYGLRWGTGS